MQESRQLRPSSKLHRCRLRPRCGGARSGARVVARRDPRATLGSDRRDLLRSQTLRRAPAFMDDVHFLLAVDRLEPRARGCARLTRLEGGAPARTILPRPARGTSQPRSLESATRIREVFWEARYATRTPKPSATRTPRRADTADPT